MNKPYKLFFSDEHRLNAAFKGDKDLLSVMMKHPLPFFAALFDAEQPHRFIV